MKRRIIQIPLPLNPFFCTWPVVFAIWAVALADLAAAEHRGTASAEQRRDATIFDLTSVNSQIGWAVGDRGAIWHTSDGGAQWTLQDTPVDCTLHSVTFLDARLGWAAGGSTDPYTHISRGTILRTSDGGKHWTRCSKDPLPRIKRIQFFNADEGIALVAPSPLYPYGMLITTDGGRSWSVPPTDRPTRWESVDCDSFACGYLLAESRFGIMHDGEIDTQVFDDIAFGASTWIDICCVDAQTVYALRASGDLFFTRQGGRLWEHRAKLALPTGFVPQGMEAHGRHLWVFGSPGHLMLYSDDGGMHWEMQPTGQSMPLQAVHFESPERGWAAGAMGTILSTENGGVSWQIQQQRRKRAAVLGVFATARATPLEIFSQLSAGEGYSSGVLLLGHKPLIPTVPLDDASLREREALVQSGVDVVDQAFRVPITPAWNTTDSAELISGIPVVVADLCPPPLSKGNLIRAFESHVERQVRALRPDVVITHPATTRRDDPVGFQINQAVLRAVKRAATEATEGTNGVSPARLAGWQVRKVVAHLPPRQSGGISIATTRWMLTLGSTLSEYTHGARALLEVYPEQVEPVHHFSVILNNLPQGRGSGDFFSGLQHTPGGESRRLLHNHESVPVGLLRQQTGRADILKAVLASAGAGQPSSAAWQAQIHRAAAELPVDQSTRLLVDIAAENFARGKVSLAAETLAMLIDHAPEHPLAAAAWKWLLTYHTSGEFQHHQGISSAGHVQLTNTTSDATETDLPASRWGDRLQRAAPVLFRDPRIQIPLAAAFRQEGETRQAERIALFLAQATWLGNYAACATAEANLMTNSGASPWTAVRARSKPFLDGKLDDACWATAAEAGIQLADRTGITGSPTKVLTCFDLQHLYFAIRCRKADQVAYDPPPTARKRDADLTNQDRVQILLDIDRDYATCYRFTVDSRGCTHDQLWLDPTWNPEWYVARAETETHWTCELAIPFTALSAQTGTAERLWACGVQRILPGRGFQSWTTPASMEIEPAGFGHLQLPDPMD